MVTVREGTVAPKCPHPYVFSQLQQGALVPGCSWGAGWEPKVTLPRSPSAFPDGRFQNFGSGKCRGAGGVATVEQSRAAPSANQLPLQAFGHFLWGAGQRRAARGGQKPPPYPCCSPVRFAPEGSARSGQREKGVRVSRLAGCAGRGHWDGDLYKQLGWAGQGEGPGRSWEGMTGSGWPAGALSNGLGSCLCESASVCVKEPERVQMCAVSGHVSL